MAGVSVVMIVKNEAGRIRTCLESVRWADELVVVDGQSRDGTNAICREYGARVFAREMTAGFGEQKNFAVAQATQPWVLSLDADEVVTETLRRQIEDVVRCADACDGYRIPRLTWFLGRPIRHCGWYPAPVLRLFRRARGRFNDALVHEEVVVDGSVGDLDADLLHYSYESIADHLRKLDLYTSLDARMLSRRGVRLTPGAAPWLLVVKPFLAFVHRYVAQRGFMEGRHGLVLCASSAFVVFVNGVKLWELDAAR